GHAAGARSAECLDRRATDDSVEPPAVPSGRSTSVCSGGPSDGSRREAQRSSGRAARPAVLRLDGSERGVRRAGKRVCVGADGTRLLLGKRAAHRAFYPDVWDIPGGHREPGETLEQTLIRELQEEVGITPSAWHQLGEWREPIPGSEEVIVLHLFQVTSWTG